MKEFIQIVERQQLNEASLDKEIDSIVASLPEPKNGMVDRDAVLNKGFDKALALNDEFNFAKRFAINDDFIERQYFGKVAEKYGLKGMYQNTGGFVMIKKDEFGRYMSAGSGRKGSAEAQNNMGLLPGRIAKKMDLKLKFASAADAPSDQDAAKDADVDKKGPDGQYDGDDLGNAPTGIVINDDNAMKYIRRYKELMKKLSMPEGDPTIYTSKFKSVFGNLYNILSEAQLSKDEEQELKDIVAAFEKAIKDKTIYTNSIKREIRQIIADQKGGDLPGDGMSDEERLAGAGKTTSKELDFGKLPKGYRAERDGDVVKIYKGDSEMARYTIRDQKDDEIIADVRKMAYMNAGEPLPKDTAFASDQDASKEKDRMIDGALEKFADSGKGGLANDPDEVEAIKELQDRLKEMGIGMTVDGKYSKGTVDAVKRLQEMLGVKQDGDAGPNTIRALIKFNRNPGLITFYDDLKRMAELSKKLKESANDFRYFMNILEGNDLLEALTDAEQKEYDELYAKHKAKFDDGDYQMGVPKSVQDLMRQVIKPKGADTGTASDQEAGKVADDSGKDTSGEEAPKKKAEVIDGWFVPMPKDLQKTLGLGSKKNYFINLYTGNVGTIYISKSSKKHQTRIAFAPNDSDHKLIMDYLNSIGVETKKGDPRKGPSQDKDTASDQEAGKEVEYDTQYVGEFKKDSVEFFKGINLGLDPVDEMDDLIDALEAKLEKQKLDKDGLTTLKKDIDEMVQILIGSNTTPQGEVIQQSKAIRRATQMIKGWRDGDLAELTKDAVIKDKDTASDQEAGKETDKATPFNAKKIAMQINVAAKGFGTDLSELENALDKIKTASQFQQVETEYKKFNEYANIEELIKGETSFGTEKRLLAKVAKIKGNTGDDKADLGQDTMDKVATAVATSQNVGDGKKVIKMPADGDWNKIFPALGFKDKKSFAKAQLAGGLTLADGSKIKVGEVMNTPMKFAGKSIAFNMNPSSTGVTSNSNSADDASVASATAKTNGKKPQQFKNTEEYYAWKNAGEPSEAEWKKMWPPKENKTTAPAATSNQEAGKSAETKPSVEPRPEVTASGGHAKKNQTKRQQAWDKKHGATHNPDGSPKNENKEYDMTKKVNEAASMNISMSGDNAGEVSELVSILRNAGMQDAGPVTPDMMPPMASTIKMIDEPPMMDKPEGPSPCGMGEDEVEEEWDNSPDEEYKDDDYMNQDIAGGLNRPKPPGALRAKDPAIHNEEVAKYKAQLAKDLEEAYGKFTYKKTANGYEFGGKTYKSEQEARKAEQQAKLKNMGNKG